MKEMIIVHCSATPPAMDIGVREVRDWHVNGNGWRDIGYNYLIRRNGVLELGRDLDGDGDVEEETGAHTKGFNHNSIGICLVGGVDDDGNAECNYTANQFIGLANLIDRIKRRHEGITVLGHRDLDSRKECPCFDVQSFAGG